jgi:PEGA domain-containing protein
MTWRHSALVLLLALACTLPLAAQEESDLTVPKQTETLFDGAHPFVRFTVVHLHIGMLASISICHGLLDVDADTVTYHALDSDHSQSLPRTSIRKDKYGRYIFGGRVFNLFPVPPNVVAERIPWDTFRNQKYPESKNIDFGPFIENFDGALAKLREANKPPEPPKPTVAQLRLTSQPGNAQVYLDDVFKGVTSEDGTLVIEAVPGDHELRLDHADYKEWKGKVTLASERSEQKVELVKRGPEPLAESDIEEALTNGMTPARLGDLVKQYGVNFAVTPEIEKKLRDKGADSDLLLVIAMNKR